MMDVRSASHWKSSGDAATAAVWAGGRKSEEGGEGLGRRREGGDGKGRKGTGGGGRGQQVTGSPVATQPRRPSGQEGGRVRGQDGEGGDRRV